MADEVDIAQELEQRALSHALANRGSPAALRPKGSCYNCTQPIKPQRVHGKLQHVRVFCDRTCADDWEKREAARTRRIAS